MEIIKWGIIGCGDVTEVKSGPAFNKISGSSLVAVMRRDAEKAKDYAVRHGVPKWYDDANSLINDPEINAIYIATPPLYHEEYAVAALNAGKPVYLEKPMALNGAACRRIMDTLRLRNGKLCIAHYRRALPLFMKIHSLLDENAIGEIRLVNLQLWQAPKPAAPGSGAANWRTDAAVSGGGLFHDLAPHQLDLIMLYFGDIEKSFGSSANQGGYYQADDIVSGEIVFRNGVFFKGLWCFTVAPAAARDYCEIVGTRGTMRFSFFSNMGAFHLNGVEHLIEGEAPRHVQQPMIERVVKYFQGEGENPCTGEEAIEVMRVIDGFTARGTAAEN